MLSEVRIRRQAVKNLFPDEIETLGTMLVYLNMILVAKEETAIAQGQLEVEFDFPHPQKLKEAVILCCNMAGYAVKVIDYLGGTFLLKLTWEKKGENKQAA